MCSETKEEARMFTAETWSLNVNLCEPKMLADFARKGIEMKEGALQALYGIIGVQRNFNLIIGLVYMNMILHEKNIMCIFSPNEAALEME